VSAIDHATTGIKLSKNGSAAAVRHATVTASSYDSDGIYRVTLDTTDTGTLGMMQMRYSDPTTTLEVVETCVVVPAGIYDAFLTLGSYERALRSMVLGTVGSSSTTTSIITSSVTPSAGVVNGWAGRIVTFDGTTTTAALRDQSTDITANTSGATPTLTVTALTTAPASGDTFTIT
jgi:hypothetical protein